GTVYFIVSRSAAASLEHGGHEFALGLGVGGSIIPISLGRCLLERPVCGSDFRAGDQVVAEEAVPRKLSAVRGANVQVMGRSAGRRGKGFTARDAEVALVDVADGGEAGD